IVKLNREAILNMAKTKKHPGTLRLKGKSWHLTLWVGGKPHYFALGPMTRPDAEEAARREYARLQGAYSRGAGTRTLKPLRMSELFTEFETNVLPDLAPNTQKTYLCTLKKLRAYFVDQLRDPRADHVTRR